MCLLVISVSCITASNEWSSTVSMKKKVIFIYLNNQPIDKYLLNAYQVPVSLLGTGDIIVNKLCIDFS